MEFFGKVLWADGPFWGPRRQITDRELDDRPEFYDAILTLLMTGTGQVSLFDVSGDSEHYWLAEPAEESPSACNCITKC